MAIKDRLRPWLVPVALAVLTFVAVPTGMAFAGGRVTVEGALPLAQALAFWVLVTRRFPVVALLCSIAVVGAFRSAELTDVGWVWPATVAFGAAVAKRTGATIAIGATYLAFAASWEAYVDPKPLTVVAGRIGGEVLWLALVVAAVLAYRNWRRWQHELAARLEQTTRQRRAEERVRIAGELHDIVSHTLAVVGVQLNVALDTLDHAPGEARDALGVAQRVRGKAMTDLHDLVRLLREDPIDGVPPPVGRLEALDQLVDRVRDTGLDVTLAETGDRSAVPAPVALAAYRIVQEALTNTVRHADARHAAVRLAYAKELVTVDVTDDGRGGEVGEGFGIAGMRDRVAALDGTVTAGPGASGFAVHAEIPTGLR